MSTLRIIAVAASLVCHAALAAAMLKWDLPPQSVDVGTGTDAVNVEGAISIAGLPTLGNATETLRAVEAQELPTQVAQAAAEEVKPKDELQNVIASRAETATEVAAVEELQPTEQPRPKQVAVEEVVQQEVKPDQIAASKAVARGDPGQIAAYKGELWKAISKNQVVPDTRQTATVKVSFRIGRNGELVDWRIVSSSGSKAHEDASVKALKKTSPFPPLPAALAGYDDPFEIEFRYRLQ